MKKIWDTITKNNDEHTERFLSGSTLFMILLFLIFWGASFYVLMSGLA